MKTLKIYQWDELTEDVRAKVLQKHSDINVHHAWDEFILEDAKNAGIKIESYDTDHYCKGKFIEDAIFTAHFIKDNHGAETETFKTAEKFLAERDEIVNTAPKDENGEFENERELDEKLDACEDDFLKMILEDYRIMLRKDFEYQTSEAQIIESIKANEYYFDSYGNIQTPSGE